MVYTSVQKNNVDSKTLVFGQDAQYVRITYPEIATTNDLLIDAVAGEVNICSKDLMLDLDYSTCSNYPKLICLDDLINLDSAGTSNSTAYTIKSATGTTSNSYYEINGNAGSTGEDCCDNGSLEGLTFKYQAVSVNDNSQVPMGKASVTTYGSPSGADVKIVINGSTTSLSSPYKTATLSVGDVISLDKNTEGWSNPIVIHVLSADGSTEYQVIEFHTSCSAPVVVGEDYGFVELYSTVIDGAVCGNNTGPDCENVISYIPNASFIGNDTVTFEVCENIAGTDYCQSQKVVIEVKDSSCSLLNCHSGFEQKLVTSTSSAVLSAQANYPNKAVGTADGQFTKLENDGDYVTLVLPQTLKAGDDLSLVIASYGGNLASGTIQASADGNLFGAETTISTSTKSPATSTETVQFAFDVNYIRIKVADNSIDKLLVDGLAYQGTICAPNLNLNLDINACKNNILDLCIDDIFNLDSLYGMDVSVEASSQATTNGYQNILGYADNTGADCCDNGSPTELTFKYVESNVINNNQPAGKSLVTTYTAPAGQDVLIVANASSTPTNLSSPYFSQVVSAGESFTITENNGSWSSNMYIHIMTTDGSTALQLVQFHTSCSAPIVSGDQFGTIILQSSKLDDSSICGNPNTNDCENTLTYIPDNNFTGDDVVEVDVCAFVDGVEVCEVLTINITVKDSICNDLCPFGEVKGLVTSTSVAIASSDAKDVNRSLGAPDGSFAQLENTNDYIVFELDKLLSAGDNLYLDIASYSTKLAEAKVEVSLDGINFIGAPVTVSTNSQKPNFVTETLQFNTDAQYVRITLTSGSLDKMMVDGLTYDGTICVPGNVITGTVLHDVNADTTINTGEIGEPNVKVYLYSDANGNGILDPSETTAIDSTVTDPTGFYGFTRDFEAEPITVCKSITSSIDDAEQRVSNGQMYTNSSDLELVDDFDYLGMQVVGLRFTGLNIPAGSQIQTASIQFAVDETVGSNGTISIAGHDVANSPAFSTSAYNISSRTKTSATTSWSPDYTKWNVAHEQTPDQETPDLSSVVQEIIDNTGWSNNNAMTFIFSGTGSVSAEAYDGEPTLAPKLCITYYEPGSEEAYIIKIAEDDLPNNSTLTTDNIETAVFTSRGQTDSLNDFGYVKLGTISGVVGVDTDDDGETPEEFLAGVTITLVSDLNNNGIADIGEPSQTTTTSANGKYKFEGLSAGDYLVIETQPTEFESVRDGDNSDDGDAFDLVFDQNDTILVTLNYEEIDANNDFLEEVQTGSISGTAPQATARCPTQNRSPNPPLRLRIGEVETVPIGTKPQPDKSKHF